MNAPAGTRARVLVAYATTHGSTRQIALRIGDALRQQGLTAEIAPVDQLDHLAGFDAVVLGSAVHRQSWLPEATEFVRTHQAALTRRPVWFFSVGMVAAMPRRFRGWMMREGPMAVAVARQSIEPAGERLFSGVVTPDQYPLSGRIVFRLMGGRYGDYRDWRAIEAWGRQIAAELSSAGVRRLESVHGS